MMHIGVELFFESVVDTLPGLDWLECIMLVAIALMCASAMSGSLRYMIYDTSLYLDVLGILYIVSICIKMFGICIHIAHTYI